MSAEPNSRPPPRDSRDETDTSGRFKRVESGYRRWIGAEEGQLPAEAGRYHLYISLACPWACRCLAALHMKGLTDTISYSIVHPTWGKTRPNDESDPHYGWVFRSEADEPIPGPTGMGSHACDGCIPDTVNNFSTVRALYDSVGDTIGKFSVPVLWDKHDSSIVNNESSEILRMFNSAFQEFASNPELDLYPEALRQRIDAVNEWIYTSINNGVYRSGFAKSQLAYDEAVHELYDALARAEQILSRQRFLCGNTFTEADLRLFVTLVRFDPVYTIYFKCSKGSIANDFPALAGHCADVFQMAGVAASVNLQHIKTHYYTSHPTLNHYGVIPADRDSDPYAWLKVAHGREAMTDDTRADVA